MIAESSNHTHHVTDGELVQCSDAQVICDENDVDTGFRYCPHIDATFTAEL